MQFGVLVATIAAIGVPSRQSRDVEMHGRSLAHFVACKFLTRLCRPTSGGLDVQMYASPKPPALADAFRQIRPGLLAAGGLSIFINLLVFVSPLYTMQIYDRVLTSRNGVTLVMISLIVGALFLAYAALEHYRARILVQAGVRFDQFMSGPAFEAALCSALRAR